MLPVIALIGNTNVGKSTLFNRLTRSSSAIVEDTAGLTRDRQYGEATVDEQRFIIVDTAGFVANPSKLDESVFKQSEQAIEESDIVFFLIDVRAGISVTDQELATKLRRLEKPVYLIANKIDGIDENTALGECYQLGFQRLFLISATHGRGVTKLMADVVIESEGLKKEDDLLPEDLPENSIKIAIVGRPNVGKSTLVNRMLGEERVVVYDLPGTTRDSIYIPFERFDQHYVLIDTAGVRRRKSINEKVEKVSIIRTLQAIDAADVVIQLMDASEGVVDQDLHLTGFVLEKGKSLVLSVNKWDGLSHDARRIIRSTIDRRLTFADFVPIRFISALHGTGVGNLFDDANRCYQSVNKHWQAKMLTDFLIEFVSHHQPPMVQGRRIKLRFAHQGGTLPPLIIIHGNLTSNVPDHYRRYLSKCYQKVLKIIGTAVRIEFKTGDNPYKNKRNRLSDRQIRKRQRLMSYSKKAKKRRR